MGGPWQEPFKETLSFAGKGLLRDRVHSCRPGVLDVERAWGVGMEVRWG